MRGTGGGAMGLPAALSGLTLFIVCRPADYKTGLIDGSFTTLLVGVMMPPIPIGLMCGSDRELAKVRPGDNPKSLNVPLL